MIYIIGNDGTPQRVDGIGNELYPVGSIYMSTTNEKSPAERFGGTWERIKDCFLWATGDTASITYTENGVSVTKSLTAGSTGGESTHTLTINEMPSHAHDIGLAYMVTDGNKNQSVWWAGGAGYKTNNTGGDQPHNNMPPYLAVYMWKRIS